MTNVLNISPSTSERMSMFTIFPGGPNIQEKMGPAGFERFCYVGKNKITFPRFIKFANCLNSAYKNIVIKAKSKVYDIPRAGSDETSIEQYFLEHPLRDNIQFIFWKTGTVDTSSMVYHADVPGLVYTGTGVVLGYLHSYVADIEGHITLELPYDDYIGYSINGGSFEQTGNLIQFTISSDTDVTLTKGSDTATFRLYKEYGSGSFEIEIKDINEYVDYVMSAQFTDGKINNILNMFTAIEERNEHFYPKNFASLSLYTSSESVANNTPSIFKVPAALVADDYNNKHFMKNITGVSVNVY